MFKFVAYQPYEDTHTTLEFRGGDEAVEVFNFDGNFVAIKSENEAEIDALIAKQPTEIRCTALTQEEFNEAVKESRQIENLRRACKEKIAKRYSIADEIGMMKRAASDSKRVEYEAYVNACLSECDAQKADMGYIKT